MSNRGTLITAAMLAGAVVTSGTPTGLASSSVSGLLDTRAKFTYEEWCYLKDADRDHIWGSGGNDDLNVGPWFDDWLSRNGEKDWVQHMDAAWVGEPTDMVCGDDYATTECTTRADCKTYYYAGQATTWWVFRALNKFYQGLGTIAHYVDSETIGITLNTESIIETFGETMDQDNSPWAIISAALGIAGAVTGGNPYAAAGLGIFSGITSLIGEFAGGDAEAPNNRAAIEEALSQLFEAQKRSITMVRELAVHGEYNSGSNTYDSNHLPMQSGNSKYAVARFFDGGKWLMDSDMTTDMVREWRNKYYQYAMQGIITSLLKSQGYFIYVMEGVENEDQCYNEYEGSIREWIDGIGCADFFKFTSDKYTRGQSAMTVDSDMVYSMRDEKFGGLNFKTMYERAIWCAKSNPDGKGAINPDDFSSFEEIPSCFYNYPVVKGKDRKLGHNIREIWVDPTDQINTSGRVQWSW